MSDDLTDGWAHATIRSAMTALDNHTHELTAHDIGQRCFNLSEFALRAARRADATEPTSVEDARRLADIARVNRRAASDLDYIADLVARRKGLA